MTFQRIAFWLSFSSLAFAGVLPKRGTPVVERQAASTTTLVPDGACTNGPRTRSCWSNGFSISTDFDAKSPPAGKTVTFNLEITNTTANPDGGGEKPAMLINGQYPGPVIQGNWGDTFVINVKNSLQDNGTGIHWHGIRQLNSCQNDGVPGITECPIAPGKTRTYTFKATQFGTTWYHSHWSAQYGEGVVGSLIINGPAAANYDEDLGVLPLSDWYYQPGFTLNEQAQHSQTGPPTPDNILVNGTHVNANGGGKYFKMTVTKGKKYRIRLINMSVDSDFQVSFDNHPFTVMTSDFVPIKSYVTNVLTLAIGQRYDVVINANQTAGNYWFRSIPCGGNNIKNANLANIGAILSYSGVTAGNPTSTGYTFPTTCDDEPRQSLVPFVPNTVPSGIVTTQKGEMDLSFYTVPEDNNLFRWTIEDSTFVVDWNTPNLQLAMAGATQYPNNSNIYNVPTKNNWYLWYIQNTAVIPLAHPIHLHGHDFYILDQKASATWDGSTTGLTFTNPTRRDTATLPAAGYLLIAFPADNPGVWVMHCHIAWHASQGLSVQFLEQPGTIKGAIGDTSQFTKGCSEWNDYWVPGNHPYNQTDSGI